MRKIVCTLSIDTFSLTVFIQLFVTNIIKVVVVRFNVTFTKWHEATGGKLSLKEHYVSRLYHLFSIKKYL